MSNSTIGCRILVAEDHLDSRLAIVALLEAGGYLVHAVPDGEEALLALIGQSFDLLLTDLWMPDLDGEGLIQTVRQQERYNAMPIILMTASSDSLKRFASLIQGSIRKPFAAVALFQLLDDLHCGPTPTAVL